MIGKRFAGLLAAAAVAAAAVYTTFAVRNDFGLGRNMEIAVNMMRELSLNYVDPVDPDLLMTGAAEGMVRALDPYTEFIPEEGMSDFELLTTGKYGGIGALIRQKEDYVRIAQPYEGSPADRAGLKIGDMILAIDGTDAKGFTTEQVSSRLKGEPGSKVRVTVRHLDGTEQTETIRRERIAIPGIPYAGWLDEGIGYIRHSDFTEGCYEEMRAAIERLRTEGELRGLVLDYRSNGGGIMQEAVKILGLFVPKGTEVLSTKGRTEESKQSYRTETEPLLPDLPLAVLVNGNSASASEIVAGALQDLDRAVLVGQRSFGKGLVQSSRPLGYNAMLKLTTAKYYIPSGRCIQAIDYSHSQQGSVRTVPDSLISEFSTRAGRKVYDGGGIMPDIHTEAEYISRFAATLYALGFIEDFGDEYTRRNPTLAGDPVRFSITEADYADFAEFMKDKEVPYESDTRRALKALQKAAESDRFAELKERFGELEAELGDDTQTNLETYRRQIVESIESDIIQRHAYTSGVIAHSLLADKEVHRAVEALRDTAEYRRITTEQDTEKQFKTKN
ncbi:MAG: S41 family peptidase [Alistipes sp.]|nr:S41 family peptidase [Alistipes sp.]